MSKSLLYVLHSAIGIATQFLIHRCYLTCYFFNLTELETYDLQMHTNFNLNWTPIEMRSQTKSLAENIFDSTTQSRNEVYLDLVQQEISSWWIEMHQIHQDTLQNLKIILIQIQMFNIEVDKDFHASNFMISWHSCLYNVDKILNHHHHHHQFSRGSPYHNIFFFKF